MSNHSKSYVVVTRPEPGLSETIKQVQLLGWRPLKVPLMNVEVLDCYLDLENVQAFVFTSRQAIDPTIQQLQKQNIKYQHIPVFTVGDVTAQDAKSAGFIYVYSAHKDAIALAALLKNNVDPRKGKLLFLSAEKQGISLKKTLVNFGFMVELRNIYRIRSIDQLPDILVEKIVLHEVKTIMFFSSQTALFFINLLDNNLKTKLADIQAIGISEKVRGVLEMVSWRKIDIASHPSTKKMLSLL